jgi:hypothetical protein
VGFRPVSVGGSGGGVFAVGGRWREGAEGGAVEEGDSAEARAAGRSGGGVTHKADRVVQQSLDSIQEGPRKGVDGPGVVGENAAHLLRHLHHQLSGGSRRNDALSCFMLQRIQMPFPVPPFGVVFG